MTEGVVVQGPWVRPEPVASTCVDCAFFMMGVKGDYCSFYNEELYSLEPCAAFDA